MNLADPMRSQDNIYKVVSHEREYNLLPISDRRKDQQITGKKGSMQVLITSHKQKNMLGEEDIHTSAWNLKRQYKFCKFGLKAERVASRSSQGRSLRVTQANMS